MHRPPTEPTACVDRRATHETALGEDSDDTWHRHSDNRCRIGVFENPNAAKVRRCNERKSEMGSPDPDGVRRVFPLGSARQTSNRGNSSTGCWIRRKALLQIKLGHCTFKAGHRGRKQATTQENVRSCDTRFPRPDVEPAGTPRVQDRIPTSAVFHSEWCTKRLIPLWSKTARNSERAL